MKKHSKKRSRKRSYSQILDIIREAKKIGNVATAEKYKMNTQTVGRYRKREASYEEKMRKEKYCFTFRKPCENIKMVKKSR